MTATFSLMSEDSFELMWNVCPGDMMKKVLSVGCWYTDT